MIDISKPHVYSFNKIQATETTTGVKILQYAIHEGKIVLMNMFGPPELVSSVRGKVIDGATLKIDGGYSMRMSVEMAGKGHIWKQTLIEQHRKMSASLTSTALVRVVPGMNYTYVMGRLTSENRHPEQSWSRVEDKTVDPYADPDVVKTIGQRLAGIVKIGILPQWNEAIIRKVRNARPPVSNLIVLTSCEGCRVWAVKNDPEAWTILVSSMVKDNELTIEEVQ